MKAATAAVTIPGGAVQPPTAIVMNLFYTGLGIARSLGENKIPVIGLTAHPRSYGNFTRYACVRSCPDSRENPAALLDFLLRLGETTPPRSIIFPTRDDDVVFLERFRKELEQRFVLFIPETTPLKRCLDKWETYLCASAEKVPAPRSWVVSSKPELLRIAPELPFPCVMKPVSQHHWRKARNWQIVGGRKAFATASLEELCAEYDQIARAERRVLIQEMVPGGDDCLWIAACYLDRQARYVAGFTARKLVQVPEIFGTGCIIEAVSRPDLLDVAARILERMHFTGIAEVEFKWDAPSGEYKLIEINPRPWDQHRLGNACGIHLIHIAYCDSARLPLPPLPPVQTTGHKWIAEDVFCWSLLRALWRRDGRFRVLLHGARGKRVWAIWAPKDPLPFLAFVAIRFIPDLAAGAARYIGSFIRRMFSGKTDREREVSHGNYLQSANCKD
jgi:predicted ATP-grasp superfamily ATP-dependent carboligase